jgi:hypothetical protein
VPARVRGGTTLTAGDARFFRRPAMGRAFPMGSLAALAGDLPSKLEAHGGEPLSFFRVCIHH